MSVASAPLLTAHGTSYSDNKYAMITHTVGTMSNDKNPTLLILSLLAILYNIARNVYGFPR